MKKPTKYLLALTLVAVCLFLVVHVYYFIAGFAGGGADISLFQAITMSIEHFFRQYAFFIIVAILVVWLIYFWLTVLIDCIRRDFGKSSDRLLWVLVIIFAGVVGAAVYYFMIIKKKSAGQ